MGLENPVHLIFIGIIALLVLGPKRLPELARALGHGIREFREAIGGQGETPQGAVFQPPGSQTPIPQTPVAEAPATHTPVGALPAPQAPAPAVEPSLAQAPPAPAPGPAPAQSATPVAPAPAAHLQPPSGEPAQGAPGD